MKQPADRPLTVTTPLRDGEWRWTPTTEELLAEWGGSFRFIMTHNAGSTIRARRERAQEVVRTILEGLRELGIEPALLEPLDEIETALVEADRGIADPLFEPDCRKGRRRLSFWEMEVRKTAVLAMELYILADIDKQAAATRVANALQKLKAPLKGKTGAAPWKIVAEWRDGLSRMARASGHATDAQSAFAASWFDYRRQNLRKRVRDRALEPMAAAEELLKHIEGVLRRSGK